MASGSTAASGSVTQRPEAHSLSGVHLSSGGSGDDDAAQPTARGAKRALSVSSIESDDEEVLPTCAWYAPTLTSVLLAFGEMRLKCLAGRGAPRRADSRGRGGGQGR